ncbi:MAG: DUF2510 domain-containing protein [Acidimicrobiales bacterium]|nr:DUF2510 domain-containing protein [Acidimicrobiales bacterium]
MYPQKSNAGWYPDPSGASQSRYFDGHQWTQHIQQHQLPPFSS